MKRNQVNIRLDEDMARRLDAMATRQHRTRSNMAEFLLRKVMQEIDEDAAPMILETVGSAGR
jgi:predicted transcriptional regulator